MRCCWRTFPPSRTRPMLLLLTSEALQSYFFPTHRPLIPEAPYIPFGWMNHTEDTFRFPFFLSSLYHFFALTDLCKPKDARAKNRKIHQARPVSLSRQKKKLVFSVGAILFDWNISKAHFRAERHVCHDKKKQ